jgi:ubiquinone/menaquinone biosynthesis C-methylase UbiE
MHQEHDSFASSTGQTMTGSEWLDLHFDAKRPEYEAQLRAVGIQPGWHVLDAGCGAGSYLPCIAEQIGSSGHVTAVDLAPDNVELVERRLDSLRLPCAVEALVANVVNLPFPNNTFDAVWFANTSQYQTDDELEATLAEFQRVTRPGGLVALKETDGTALRIYPAPAGLIFRWMQATANVGVTQSAGAIRTPALSGRLRQIGLLNVWERATPIVRYAPFDTAMRFTIRGLLSFLAMRAAELDLPAEDREFWSEISDTTALDRFLDNPGCSFMDINILTVGTVPGEAEV